MRLSGTKLLMSSAFHPQTDGQTEAANRVIIMYLMCFTGDRPRQWLCWLPWAKYTYNTAYQSSLQETPFRVVYGREPPTIRSYELGDTSVAAVAQLSVFRVRPHTRGYPSRCFWVGRCFDCSSMVRARRTRDDRQFSAGSGRLERRNTLLPGVDLYVVGYK
jgi:hypothetical protein